MAAKAGSGKPQRRVFWEKGGKKVAAPKNSEAKKGKITPREK